MEASTSCCHPKPKKARHSPAWEVGGHHGARLGLADLFPHSKDGLVTFRLEHRDGGVMARHPGEERLLVFSSQTHGAIAKIVFSSEDSSSKERIHANIHVLEVKDAYRGHDFGSLLVSEALASLLCEALPVYCQLEAEEDMSRHNKLVGFYERLGCSVKPNARVQYLHHDSGKTYRKVPMHMTVVAGTRQNNRVPRWMEGSTFVPVTLQTSHATRVELPDTHNKDDCRTQWLLVDDQHGHVQFRTTKGHCLVALPDGRCTTFEETNAINYQWTHFCMVRVSDVSSHPVKDTPADLWGFQSHHGTFLTLHRTITFACSEVPSFWYTDENGSLICTKDTPAQRQHYRNQQQLQTIDYVLDMHKRYMSFEQTQMTIRQALDLVRGVPAFPFSARAYPSLRSLCFFTAEMARAQQHPDWIQLVALLHGLASVMNQMDPANETEQGYDWTLVSRSHVVHEFRPDETGCSPLLKGSSTCGRVLLAWTGPEYLFHMLNHNQAGIPEEGLNVLRLFPLYDWHTNYQTILQDDYEELIPFVQDFDVLRRQARESLWAAKEELSDEHCNMLWDTHYAQVAAKYELEGLLSW